MTIHIMPQQQPEIKSQQNIKKGAAMLPLIYLPNPNIIYQHRKERFQLLAKANPLAHYFELCAKINHLQLTLVNEIPITKNISDHISITSTDKSPPLQLTNYALTQEWQHYLTQIIDGLIGFQPQIDQIIQPLMAKTSQEKQIMANHLLNGSFEKVNSGESLFIWSALSCYYTQLASQLADNINDLSKQITESPLCPICHNHPVGSVVHLGSENGLRYLQCSLCETQWYAQRVKCTNCQQMSAIDYYSLDKELAAIKTECCNHCHGYLKICYQDIDPKLDIVVDDLNSLILDEEMEKAGFAKTGLNPMLFP